MSLIVEDGTGLTNAESFISVADADSHLSSIGYIEWTGLNPAEKEQALRRATLYMEQAYRLNWQGLRRNLTQRLSWPRWDVWVDCYPISPDIVPHEVAIACAQLAFKAASGDLNADLTRGVTKETIGPISTEYDRYSPQAVRYPSVDQLLAPYLESGGAAVRLSRA